MKKKILTIFLCAGAMLVNAQETPRWLRNAVISPDGTTVAFTYKGDIYTVDSNGGEAKQLILEEQVLVNDEVCTMRGKKLRDGDKFEFAGQKFVIVHEAE